MTVWHLRDLANKTCHRVHCDDVKVMKPPQYEGLSIEDMLEFA